MKKWLSYYIRITYLFIIFASLGLYTCEDIDTSPPTITISSHSSGQTVGEIVVIKVNTNDNEGIKKVEFYINDSLMFNCTKPPFEYQWFTMNSEDGDYMIKVISYDNAGNYAESQPILLIVDNTFFTPDSVNVLSVSYNLSEMSVIWQESYISDFKQYNLYHSNEYDGNKVLVNSFYNIEDTIFVTPDFDPTISNWYWVDIKDTLGLVKRGQPMSNKIEQPPNSSTFSQIKYKNNTFEVNWTQNSNSDFKSYRLFQSDSANLYNKNLIFESENIDDTIYIVENITLDTKKYYQIVVTDVWDLKSISEIGAGSSYERILYLMDDAFYSIDIEGDNNTQLTTEFDNMGWYFDISTDGKHVVFFHDYNLYILEIDTEIVTNLNISGVYPKFSHDKSKIVYIKNSFETNFASEVFIVNSDGTNEQRLTYTGGCFDPTFIQDDSRIVFTNRTENSLHMMNVDGSNQVQLISTNEEIVNPIITSDSEKIIYYSDSDIFIIDIDGRNPAQLTFLKEPESPYTYDLSPDDKKVVFCEDLQIYEINIDDTNQNRITSLNDGLSSNISHLNYSSNGSKISFHNVQIFDNNGIYIMDINGSNMKLISSVRTSFHDFIPR